MTRSERSSLPSGSATTDDWDARAIRRARQPLKMPPSYSLRRGLHWALCGGRVIFLDLLADRYFGLSQALEEAFLRFCSGDLADRWLDGLRPLVERRLLVENEDGGRADPIGPVEPATADFLDEQRSQVNPLDLLAVLWAQARWSFLLRSRRLEEIAAGIESRSCKDCRSPPGADRRIARIGAAFCASSLLLPASDRCLVRALAFQDLCTRSRIYPQLVFGVRVNPFRAHSWVQLEGRVLIGDYEQVRLFTPVAAVG